MNVPAAYRGRFAPTPSGPLHLGSLLTALASWLQARAAGGRWLLRIDDLDAPRCPPGAADAILRQLEAHALTWDETPRVQRRHVPEYESAFATLQRAGVVYPCWCTRAELAAQGRPGPDGAVYAGTCRAVLAGPVGRRAAWRLRLRPGTVALADAWQGPIVRDTETDIGDFTVRRADGQIGYQLASVVDEAAQGITEIVRGADLVGSTLRQALLRAELGLPSVASRHLPVLVDAAGRKLSKQNHAAPVDDARAAATLVTCLRHLGQHAPDALAGAAAPVVLEWALAHWNPAAVPHGNALFSGGGGALLLA